jgi:mannobiose 2-epimerase
MNMKSRSIQDQEFRKAIENELFGNILPFWMKIAPDEAHGGFYGAISNDLQVLNRVPRSAILCARILWAYSAAYRLYGEAAYLQMAERAYAYLTGALWDQHYGGVYWLVDYLGKPVNDRKHSYAQAFAIYGLSEYFRATREVQSLQIARELFQQLEAHAYDPVYKGYIEGCSREWGSLDDMRLSDKEINCRKSMNTLLHIMEAYTNLSRVWKDELPALCGQLKRNVILSEAKDLDSSIATLSQNDRSKEALWVRLRELIEIFLEHVIDPQTYHFKLFFDDRWNSLKNDLVSYGHDIEGSWLLVEAAEVLGEPVLIEKTRSYAVAMAQAVFHEGLDPDGSVIYEGISHVPESADRHWWVQAEAVVGFYNAFQISGQAHFAQAASGCWEYIEDHFVDREYGDWFKVLNRQGIPYPDRYKVGPWECPYHHSRACMEMMQRLST